MAGAPQTFVEDLAAFLAVDATVRTCFTGGVFNTEAATTSELPYLGFHVTDSTRANVIGGAKGADFFTVAFFVRDTDSASAFRLAERLKGVLLPQPTWTPQPFSGPYGKEVGRYTNGPDSLAQDPEHAPYGKDCWCYTFPVVFIVARG